MLSFMPFEIADPKYPDRIVHDVGDQWRLILHARGTDLGQNTNGTDITYGNDPELEDLPYGLYQDGEAMDRIFTELQKYIIEDDLKQLHLGGAYLNERHLHALINDLPAMQAYMDENLTPLRRHWVEYYIDMRIARRITLPLEQVLKPRLNVTTWRVVKAYIDARVKPNLLPPSRQGDTLRTRLTPEQFRLVEQSIAERVAKAPRINYSNPDALMEQKKRVRTVLSLNLRQALLATEPVPPEELVIAAMDYAKSQARTFIERQQKQAWETAHPTNAPLPEPPKEKRPRGRPRKDGTPPRPRMALRVLPAESQSLLDNEIEI